MSGWQLWVEEERLVLLLLLHSRVVHPFTREDAPPLLYYIHVCYHTFINNFFFNIYITN